MNRYIEGYSEEIAERGPRKRSVIARVASQIHGWLAVQQGGPEVTPRAREKQLRPLPYRASGGASTSLEHSLTTLCEEFLPGGGIRFRIFVSGHPKKLSPEIQEQIYLIGREAMLNAWRHAQATSIEAEVEYLSRGLRLAVRDNGRGIDPQVVKSGRTAYWGLLAMRERAESIGAKLRIWSGPGAGTEMEISVTRDFLVEACA
jgi:signal transduction histidine kinase